MTEQDYRLDIIGLVDSPYRQKFGIPRQPGLCPSIPGRIVMRSTFNDPDAFRGIEDSSHIWVLFIFHHQSTNTWQPLVRPPKLGGNTRRGVFATRSPYRPNRIGQSVVKLETIEISNQQVVLHISGHDLLDGSPVVDIKPYLPYADIIETADSGYPKNHDTSLAPDHYSVTFSDQAQHQCSLWQQQQSGDLSIMLTQLLSQDPRPGYHADKSPDRHYGLRFFDFEVLFSFCNSNIVVDKILPLETN